MYPPRDLVLNADEQYSRLQTFGRADKPSQRMQLNNEGIRTPLTNSARSIQNFQQSSGQGTLCLDTQSKYIVRPRRHSKGIGWRLTDDWDDFDPATEYIQELYPKTHEYRIIFVLGTPLITLYKQADGLAQDQPWNHAAGASFVTVNNWENNRLRHFDVYDRLRELDVIKSAHIVAADVLYASKKNGYAVTELNFCPSLTIPDNIEKVKQHVLQVRSRT